MPFSTAPSCIKGDALLNSSHLLYAVATSILRRFALTIYSRVSKDYLSTNSDEYHTDYIQGFYVMFYPLLECKT